MPNSVDNDTPVLYASGTSSAATPKALNNNSWFDFDAQAIHADADSAVVQVTLTNTSTPQSGDFVDLRIKWSADGTTFDTDEHAQALPRMDTFATNDPGENPATRTYSLTINGRQAFKLGMKANQGASRAINATAVYNEHRSN